MTNDNFEMRRQYKDEQSICLVNPTGTLHYLPETLANERLLEANWRLATEEEIDKLNAQNGSQNMKSKTRIAPSLVGSPGRNAEDTFNDPNSQVE